MRVMFAVLAGMWALVAASSVPAEPWALAVDANLMLTQNAYSDSWVGGEAGSISWAFNSNSLAERQLSDRFHSKSTLKLSFGQTHSQDSETKHWAKPQKATDLIELESVLRLTLGAFADPFLGGRVETQFLDASDPTKDRYLNPVTLTETFGVARVLIGEEGREWVARLGAGSRQYIDRDVPFLLRRASHGITTEGIALMFGAMAKNEQWLTEALKLDPGEAARAGQAARRWLRTEKLVFARWTQVMVRFEHGMYSDPEQSLGQLWWGLKKRYQLLNPPETVDRPDYAAKAHILTTPVYYHSYQMGDLFAAQVQHHIAREVLDGQEPGKTSFHGKPEVGAYLREKVFAPGNLYRWDELTERATGEKLTARYFAAEFVE